MLHSALPRAYLTGAPGMGYLGGYLEEIQHPYASYAPQHLEQAYSRLSEQRVLAWDAAAHTDHHRRASTPCPLDLSLKPPPPPPSSSPSAEEYEAIEVDDEEDRRSREEARTRQENVVVDDEDSQRSCSSGHSYHRPKKPEAPILGALSHQEAESLRLAQLSAYPDPVHEQRKLLLTSPSTVGQHHLQTYHQLLQTPQQQQQQHFQGIHAPITPPSTPSPPQCPRRKNREEDAASSSSNSSHSPATKPEKPPRAKKKHARRLKFDEDTSSPVSGTVILGPDEAVVTGDIDPAFNIVEVTEEARAELAKIENRLGPYQCKLCRQLHDDAFQLAQHRCSRIAHVEYRCPECDKRFSCPANLASHRRWHKPRPAPSATGQAALLEAEIACARCDAKFSRQAALRKHVAAHHPNEQNNNNNQGEELACKQQQIGSAAAAMGMA